MNAGSIAALWDETTSAPALGRRSITTRSAKSLQRAAQALRRRPRNRHEISGLTGPPAAVDAVRASVAPEKTESLSATPARRQPGSPRPATRGTASAREALWLESIARPEASPAPAPVAGTVRPRPGLGRSTDGGRSSATARCSFTSSPSAARRGVHRIIEQVSSVAARSCSCRRSRATQCGAAPGLPAAPIVGFILARYGAAQSLAGLGPSRASVWQRDPPPHADAPLGFVVVGRERLLVPSRTASGIGARSRGLPRSEPAFPSFWLRDPSLRHPIGRSRTRTYRCRNARVRGQASRDGRRLRVNPARTGSRRGNRGTSSPRRERSGSRLPTRRAMPPTMFFPLLLGRALKSCDARSTVP